MSESTNLPFNFGGISDEKLSDYDAARVLIFPIAYEGTVSYGTGTGEGAEAIIEASRNMELYDEELDAETFRLGIHTLPTLAVEGEPERVMSVVYDHARDLIASDKFICMVGGEHSLTAPMVRAYRERYENLSVLQIDAHADLRESYDGTPYSHASVMRRITEDLKVPAVQCGIRSLSADEARAIETLPTRIFWAKDVARPRLSDEAVRDWQAQAIDALSEDVYLTIDVDGFDPSLMPHTGTPEPGGFGWYDVLDLIKRLSRTRRVVGMDLVEYAHTAGADASAFLCAKLIYKSLGYIFANDPRLKQRRA